MEGILRDMSADIRRILVVGAGGGADILAAEIVRSGLQNEYRRADVHVAGWLNPAYRHVYANWDEFEPEVPVSRIKPILRRRPNGSSHPSVDRTWFHHVDATRTWLLSMCGGIEPLAEFASGFDFVVLCDCGGDILFHSGASSHIKTPVIDGLSLAMLAQSLVKNPKQVGIVAILAAGLDGEFTRESLIEALDRIKASHLGSIELSSTHRHLLRQMVPYLSRRKGGTCIRLMEVISRTGSPARIEWPDRDVESFRSWFNQVLTFDARQIIGNNPISQAGTYSDAINLAKEAGWEEPIGPPAPAIVDSTSRAILVTGTVGIGKTETAKQLWQTLGAQDKQCAWIDLDELGMINWTNPDDIFNWELTLANLASLSKNYYQKGAKQLVLSGVVENKRQLSQLEEAIGVEVTVVLLLAPKDSVEARLRKRETTGGGLDWNLARAPELFQTLLEADFDTFMIDARSDPETMVWESFGLRVDGFEG
jgi:adenylylsulfate kinase